MKKTLYSLLFVLAIFSNTLTAQEGSSVFSYSIGADFVSRYIWRGLEFGGSPAVPQIQPYASLNFQLHEKLKFELGAWASYSFTGSYNENDLYAKLSFDGSKAGTFALVLNDYYYPFAGIAFSNFDGDGLGAHTIEAGFTFTGNAVPVNFTISQNVHNDLPDFNSLYVELGYGLKVGESLLNLFVGAAKGKSVWYGVTTEKMEIINLGVTLTKELKISDELVLPVAASWIMNPHIKNTYLVFKLSI